MSDGGRENAREPQKTAAWRTPSGDEFARAIAKIAVAQICEGEGFQTFQQSALETLSDVATRYIRDVGKTAHNYANLAGRTECNVFDIIQGLEDLGSAQGFLGASDFEHCLASSGTVRELIQYIGGAGQIPFAYALPHFPVVKDRKLTSSFFQVGEEPPAEHIPAWLPAHPDPSTYDQSSIRSDKTTEPPTAKFESENHHRKEERSLLNLHQQLASNGLGGPSVVNPVDAVKAKQAVISNPFLAAPLQFGEKEVSPVGPPAKAKLSNEEAMGNPIDKNDGMDNHVSVVETLAPDIEAMKRRLCDSEEAHRKITLNGRPTVQFKIGIGKKSLGTMLDLSPENESLEVKAFWSGKENENDNKKRRAEKIMKESTGNTKEIDHL